MSGELVEWLTFSLSHSLTAPSGPPSIESFLIMSSMSAVLQWQPPDPLEQNGVIRDYRIRLCSSRTVECEDYSTGNSGTSYEFEGIYMYVLVY